MYNDLVGEITNTISGKARRQLGSEFNSSVPEVVRERIIVLLESHVHPLAILIRWKSYASLLAVLIHCSQRAALLCHKDDVSTAP